MAQTASKNGGVNGTAQGNGFSGAWVTVAAAAERLHCTDRHVRRLTLLEDPLSHPPRPYLLSWHPTGRVTLIDARSLADFIQATQADPEFWENRRCTKGPHRSIYGVPKKG